MRIVANENSPVLRWIWVLADLLCDHLSQGSVLGEPLAGGTTDRVPTDLDRSGSSLENGLALWNNIRLMA